METVSLKVENEMLLEIDETLKKHNFGTRTEFIRASIRNSLEKYSRDDLIKEFLTYKGKSKIKTTNNQNQETRKKIIKELAEKNGWDL